MPWTNEALAARNVKTAMLRGFLCRCPNCGQGRLFSGYTKVAQRCERCGEDFTHQRADDAPPYFVMMIVGHIIVGAALVLEQAMRPPLWLHFAIWLPAAIAMSLALLPPIKGAIIGLQWANRMHGFGGDTDR